MLKLEWRGDEDWLATRLTPRKYYAPPQSAKKSAATDLNPGRWHPSMVQIPGAVGIGVEFGKFLGGRTLLVRLALIHPFTDRTRLFARRHFALWNNNFNTWDIPVQSQTVLAALGEIWEIIETVFFELQWDTDTIELHWHYPISEQNVRAIKNRVAHLNRFWETGDVLPLKEERMLVVPNIPRKKLEDLALKAVHVPYQHAWQPVLEEDLFHYCVNYLRHNETAYDMLTPKWMRHEEYLKRFRTVNRSIAKTYPWLAEAATEQIQAKEQKYANK